MRKVALIGALALALAPVAALADTVDFSIGGTGTSAATWSWGGSGTALTNAPGMTPIIQVASDKSITLCMSSCAISEFLNLISGTGTGTTDGSGNFLLNSGGSVVATNSSVNDCPSGSCFTSTFVGGELLQNGIFDTFNANFLVGNVDPNLLFELGLNTSVTQYVGTLSLTLALNQGVSLNASTGCGEGPCGHVNSGELTLTAVPEPGTLTLFGTGLLTVAGFLRRKLKV